MKRKTLRIDVRTDLIRACETLMLNTINVKNNQMHRNILDILTNTEYSSEMQKEEILKLLDNSREIDQEILTFFEPLQLRDFSGVDF